MDTVDIPVNQDTVGTVDTVVIADQGFPVTPGTPGLQPLDIAVILVRPVTVDIPQSPDSQDTLDRASPVIVGTVEAAPAAIVDIVPLLASADTPELQVTRVIPVPAQAVTLVIRGPERRATQVTVPPPDTQDSAPPADTLVTVEVERLDILAIQVPGYLAIRVIRQARVILGTQGKAVILASLGQVPRAIAAIQALELQAIQVTPEAVLRDIVDTLGSGLQDIADTVDQGSQGTQAILDLE